jgi:Lysophospholipase
MTRLADQGFLQLGQTRLEYRMIGPRPDAAPTLVLLHEGLGSADIWGGFAQELATATGTGVFAYSRAGYGQSSRSQLPRPVSFMHDEARDVLPLVLDAMGFRRGLLVGHSDGASIAAIYAGSVQDHRVRGLALMAPHFFTEDMGIAEIARAKSPLKPERCGRSSRDSMPIPTTRSTTGPVPGSIPNSATGNSAMRWLISACRS